jgi:hypothetical protein
MSRLYGSIDSDTRKKPATTQGRREVVSHVRGWHVGIEVEAIGQSTDRDRFTVYLTGGSTNPKERHELLTVSRDRHGEGPHRLEPRPLVADRTIGAPPVVLAVYPPEGDE